MTEILDYRFRGNDPSTRLRQGYGGQAGSGRAEKDKQG